jgi:ABC-type uncharacterized transport system auxiliary subunit
MLAACGSSSAPESYYYRLTAAAVPQRQGGPLPGAVEIPPLKADGMVNGRGILAGQDETGIKAYNYHSWWQAPGVMLQESLIDALRRAQAFEIVAGPEMRVRREYDVVGRIRRFERNGSRVVVEIELALRLARGGEPLLLKTYREEAPAGDTMPSVVHGFSTAVNAAWAAFVTDLGSISPPPPERSAPTG